MYLIFDSYQKEKLKKKYFTFFDIILLRIFETYSSPKYIFSSHSRWFNIFYILFLNSTNSCSATIKACSKQPTDNNAKNITPRTG